MSWDIYGPCQDDLVTETGKRSFRTFTPSIERLREKFISLLIVAGAWSGSDDWRLRQPVQDRKKPIRKEDIPNLRHFLELQKKGYEEALSALEEWEQSLEEDT